VELDVVYRRGDAYAMRVDAHSVNLETVSVRYLRSSPVKTISHIHSTIHPIFSS